MATPPDGRGRAIFDFFGRALGVGAAGIGGTIEVLQLALENTTAVIQNLAGVAEDLVSMGVTISKAVDSNQRASLSLGGTLEKNIGTFSSELKNLQGDFDTRYGTLLEVLTTGLEGQSEGLLNLVNSQKATDQNSRRTAMVFAQIQNGLNLNTEQMDELATSLFDNSRVYRVQSSRLVDALDALTPTLDDQALLGMGPEFLGAVEMLTAEAPQSAQQITKLANLLLDISDSGFEQLSRLGLLGIRDELRRSTSAEESLLLFKEAVQIIERQRVALLGDPRFTEERLINAVKESISPIFGPVMRLSRDLETPREMGDLSREGVFGSFLTQLGNAFEPLQRQLFQNFQDPGLELIAQIASFAEKNEPLLADISKNVAGLLRDGVKLLEKVDFSDFNIRDDLLETVNFGIDIGGAQFSLLGLISQFTGLGVEELESAITGEPRPGSPTTSPVRSLADSTAESVALEREMRDDLSRIAGTLQQILDRTPDSSETAPPRSPSPPGPLSPIPGVATPSPL